MRQAEAIKELNSRKWLMWLLFPPCDTSLFPKTPLLLPVLIGPLASWRKSKCIKGSRSAELFSLKPLVLICLEIWKEESLRKTFHVLILKFFFRELQTPATQPIAWKKEGRFKKKEKKERRWINRKTIQRVKKLGPATSGFKQKMESTLRVGVQKSRKAEWSLARWEAGAKWVRRGPSVSMEGDTSTQKPVPKEAKEEWVTSLCPVSPTSKHRTGVTCTFNTVTGEKRGMSDWDTLRRIIPKLGANFQPLFFEIGDGYPSPYPSYLFCVSAESWTWHSCVRSCNTCVQVLWEGQGILVRVLEHLREDKTGRGPPQCSAPDDWAAGGGQSWLWPDSSVYSDTLYIWKTHEVLAPFWSERKVIIIFTWLWHYLWVRRRIT